MRLTRIIGLAIGIIFVTTPMAFAHPDSRMVGGSFGAGLVHPLSGWDHLLAMFGIGLLSARIGGSALWALPGAFVASMIGGGIAGMLGYPMQFVEFGIAASLVVVGLAIALDGRRKVALLALISAVIGAIHGHAHGTEMPTMAAPVVYAIGFVAATCCLHFAGVLIGRLAIQSRRGAIALRWAGAVVAMAGIGFATVLG